MSRKRLGPLDADAAAGLRAEAEASLHRRARPGAGPPIARISGEVGRSIEDEIALLRDRNRLLSDKGAALDAAEAEGRVAVRIPLALIDAYAMLRDRHRLERTGEEWSALKQSLAARGQQTPIEVVVRGDAAVSDPALGPVASHIEPSRARDADVQGATGPDGVTPAAGRDGAADPASAPDLVGGSNIERGSGANAPYALVTGLRRLSALAELHAETGDPRFATVLAFVRPAAGSAETLRAMVEENEIRQDISFFERGRIVALAAGQGVFPDLDAAIAGLFAGASRQKRYKIRAFAQLHDAIGDALSYPEAIGERLGLALVKRLRRADPAALRVRLAALAPGAPDIDRSERLDPVVAELALLEDFSRGRGVFAPPAPAGDTIPVADPRPAPDADLPSVPRAGVPASEAAEIPLEAVWQGRAGARVRAVCRGPGDPVTLTIDGLAEVDRAGLERLVRWLGARMEPLPGMSED